MKYFAIVIIFISFISAFSEPPLREGIALGYMTTPNSIVYRSTLSDESAGDFWLDLPEVSLGTESELRLGAGMGYAMFFSRHDDFALMFRPQVAFGYWEQTVKRGEISLGAIGAVVAYLDNIGLYDTDIIVGASLGSVMEIGENYTTFHILLTRRSPFGIAAGVMYYF